jgi:NAD(P)-dependent dehydrogenase (short-subunit alcohol dehydrogenase family)
LSDLSLAQRSRIFEVNLHGTFLMMMGASEAMLPRGWARRVNGVASVDGAETEPNLAAYGATKDAVVQLTHAAAVDHAQAGLHIACVCSEAIDTPFFCGVADPVPASERLVESGAARHRCGRLLQPDNVAAAVEFLFNAAADPIRRQLAGRWRRGHCDLKAVTR